MRGSISRGIKNAFRNVARTFSVVFILAISIGLSLIMLLSYTTVQSKITTVKSSVGNTITLTPAGSQGFNGGGNPLTTDQINQVKALPHVVSSVSTISDRLTPSTDTSLQSAINPGVLGKRNGGFFRRTFGGGDSGAFGGNASQTQPTFSIPIQVTGISSVLPFMANGAKVTSGVAFDPNSSANVAVIGTTLASKNSLKVGSTFTAYGGTLISVVGIFDSGNTFGNANFYMPLKALQALSGQVNEITSSTLTVDSVTNVSIVASDITNKLGATNVDVVTSEDQVNSAIAPLQSIEGISLYSLFGALIAGAVITLLTMIMIVRERKKEIGVLKAIGAANGNVVIQFISESLVFAFLGSVVGIFLGIVLSNPVLSVLLKSSMTSSTLGQGGFGGGRGFGQIFRLGGNSISASISTLHTSIGFSIVLYGLLAALIIAIIGSAIPAWLIARIRPSEVMRSE